MEDKIDKECYVYDPTPSELKLLEVLCNPEFSTLNITEKCNMAEISVPTYYRAMEKEGFKKLIEKTAYELVFEELVPTIKAMAKFARINPNCSSDRKLIVQMAGMVTEKSESKNINQNIIITGEIEDWSK
jgi:hypothetical protein